MVTKGMLPLQLNWMNLYKLLDLSSYNQEGVYHQSRHKQVKKEIEPAQFICPPSMQCQTLSCQGQSLLINTRNFDASRMSDMDYHQTSF
jgi:hypothetical protein